MAAPPRVLGEIIAASERSVRDDRQYLKTRLDDLCALLALTLPEEHSFVGDTCWLAGGGVLRWLEGHTLGRTLQEGDRDFYFPSRADLVTTLVGMLERGCVLQRVHLRERSFIRRRCLPASNLPSADARRDELVSLLLGLQSLANVELLAPSGLVYQLTSLVLFDQPMGVVVHSDYSVCQFAMAREHLYSSLVAWEDALAHRVRMVNLSPPWVVRRLLKYVARGYVPRPVTPTGTVMALRRYVSTRGRIPSGASRQRSDEP